MNKNLSIFSFKLFKPVLIIIALVLIVEIVVRANYFGPMAIFQFYNYSPQALVYKDMVVNSNNDSLAWKLRPNHKTYYKGALFKTNSQGFRDKEFSNTNVAGDIKMAVMGRSISMGAGVAAEDIWTTQLQNKFDQDGTKIKVQNFSVGAYNLSQVENNYFLYADKYDPKIVILPIILPEWGMPVSLRPERIVKSFVNKWSQLIQYSGNFFIYHSLRTYIKLSTNPILSTDWSARAEQYKKIEGKEFSKVLAQFVGKLRKKGKKVVLVALPRPSNNFDSLTKFVRKGLSKWVDSHDGVHLIHADQQIADKFNLSNVIYYGDSHPNAQVHKLIYEVIYKDLQKIMN